MPARVDPINGELFCPKCQKTKKVKDFYLYQGHPKRPCKECKNKYQEEYYLENQIEIELKREAYKEANPGLKLEQRLIRTRNADIGTEEEKDARDKERRRKLAEKNKPKIIEINNDLFPRKNNARGRLKSSFTRRITRALVKNGSKEIYNKITIYLPYSNKELDNHIEKQFEWWMHWENWGVYDPKIWRANDPLTWTWQVDHIEAHSKFKYKSLTDQLFLDCWALDNLRPYSARQNVLDKDRRQLK